MKYNVLTKLHTYIDNTWQANNKISMDKQYFNKDITG